MSDWSLVVVISPNLMYKNEANKAWISFIEAKIYQVSLHENIDCVKAIISDFLCVPTGERGGLGPKALPFPPHPRPTPGVAGPALMSIKFIGFLEAEKRSDIVLIILLTEQDGKGVFFQNWPYIYHAKVAGSLKFH